jgi:hypothetical protein
LSRSKWPPEYNRESAPLDETREISYNLKYRRLVRFFREKEHKVKSITFLRGVTVVVAVITITGCAQVGGLAQAVGDGLTNYSQKDPDSFIGKAAGVGGNVYSAAGKYVSGEADKTAAAPVVAPVGGGKKK